ncbi:hypothetical protein [Flavobacterium sp. SM2513]|uniref:hypothetical protein n=1 Tax=Flavobacterium sp. SM2513 TaxID=3424766 RepID=UPI003D7FBFB4
MATGSFVALQGPLGAATMTLTDKLKFGGVTFGLDFDFIMSKAVTNVFKWTYNRLNLFSIDSERNLLKGGLISPDLKIKHAK